jgi:hypothetical protein
MGFDIQQAREDSSVDTLNTQTRQRLLRARGANAREAGRAAARSTVLDTVTKSFDILGGMGKGGGGGATNTPAGRDGSWG